MIYAIFSVILWSTVASAFKITLKYTSPIKMLFSASLTSIFVLTLISFFLKKFKILKEWKKVDYLKSLFFGFLNPFLYYFSLFKAYSLLPAQTALCLNYTWPVMISLLAIPFLCQRIKILNIFAICVSFFGVIIIITKGNLKILKFTNLEGVFYALSSAVIWAFYWILNLKDKRDDILKLLFNFLFGTIYIFLLLLFIRDFEFNFKGILGSIYIGIFEMGLTFCLWLKALSTVKAVKASNLIYLTPFISLLFIRIFVKERLFLTTFIGLFLIIFGIILQNFLLTKKKNC